MRMSLHIEWQYLQGTVPRFGSLMGPIEYAIRDAFLPAIFVGEDVSANLRNIIEYSVKQGGLGIPDPQMSSERAYNNSNEDSYLEADTRRAGVEELAMILPPWSTERKRVGSRYIWF